MKLLCIASDNYKEKYLPCIKSQEQYSLKMDYDYILISGPDDSRNWKRAKVEELYKLINLTNDDIVLIDGDCYIKKSCPAFSNFINKERSIYYAHGKPNRLNSGFIYFKNNLRSKKFINDLKEKLENPVPKGKGYFVTSEGENGHVIWLKDVYEKNNLNIFQEISKKWNCSSPKFKKEAYILHFTNDLRKEIYKYNENLRSPSKSKK